ncbi:TPA: DUF2399 domain-containing protein [Pseudomonas aeruginosa]|uniref:Wadjet anti-phage system protein JetD domain-containing protein n=1 Tax=Pseudomonas aeruginosa TaxID=287 RepID=UPI0039819F89|nr:DUF2399 domain-containing protein [Pseudomonas aeruginosa]
MAKDILVKLLARAENAAGRESLRAIAIKLSRKGMPEYWSLERFEDKLDCNAALRVAEKAKAIAIDWDYRAGDSAHVDRIILVSGDALANFLGVIPRWALVEKGEQEFSVFLNGYPVLVDVLDSWRRGAMARASRPGEVAPWLDAIRVIELCKKRYGEDIPIRRLSATLFSDSKRVEAIAPYIDALIQNDLFGESRDTEEIFSELGLVKFPPTLLLAGNMMVSYGQVDVRLARPYMGLAPTEIESMRPIDRVEYLLTVENLTTFHEMALRRPSEAVLIYTGGMPSPSWKKVYRLILRDFPPGKNIYHWGDIDGGGFRIANHLAKCCELEGRRLSLHRMNAALMPGGTRSSREISTMERVRMIEICKLWGWAVEGEGIGVQAFEQESLDVNWLF